MSGGVKMTIQQTLESLMKGLPHDEATELRALVQSWPTSDAELQQLIDANTSEILQLFQQPHRSSEMEQSANPKNVAQHPLPDFAPFSSFAHLN